jgi:hypothetical protein
MTREVVLSRGDIDEPAWPEEAASLSQYHLTLLLCYNFKY